MKVNVPAGKYVVAVSGGVDSVVLLDVLSKQKDLELVVAHFDHGIRADSQHDRKFVQDLAQSKGLVFEYEEGKLGENTSEERARKVRYEFLRKICKKHKAQMIITAHHQDDVLETMFINILRGTGRKGLTSLNSNEVLRPLLDMPKTQLQTYAVSNNLRWREDETNKDTTYLRNYIRHNIIPKLTKTQKQTLLKTHADMKDLNNELDELLNKVVKGDKLDKKLLVSLDHKTAREAMAHWLRQNGIRDFDSKTLERLVIGAKTLANGKTVEIKKNRKMLVESKSLAIVS